MADDIQSPSCFDMPDWYDSTGDGCIWYEEENNCEFYGDQFPSDSEEQTANEAVSRHLLESTCYNQAARCHHFDVFFTIGSSFSLVLHMRWWTDRCPVSK